MRPSMIVLVCAASAFGQSELEERAQDLLDQVKATRFIDLETDYDKRGFVRQLAEIGPEARCAIPHLVVLVEKAEDDFVRTSHSAADALVSMGHESLPALRALLKNENTRVRESVLTKLLRVVPFETVALYEDVFAVARDEGSRKLALRFLVRCPTQSERTTHLLMDDMENSESALRFLGEMGPNARRSIRRLRLLALESKDVRTRMYAAEALANVDPKGQFSLPILVRQLSDDGEEPGPWGGIKVRDNAISELFRHRVRRLADGEKILNAAPKLTGGWSKKYWFFLLGETGAKAAVPMLKEQVRQLRGDNPFMAVHAAAALVRLDPGNVETIEYLLSLMLDEQESADAQGGGQFGWSRSVRAEAAWALGYASKQHKQVLPALLKATKHHVERKNGGKTYGALSDMAVQAAWSVARLDRSDTACVRLLADEVHFITSDQFRPSPFQRETGESASQVLGTRIEIVMPKLTVQATKYNSNGYARFAREIVLASEPKRLHELVKYAFAAIADPEARTTAIDLFLPSEPANTLLELGPKLAPAIDEILEHCSSPNYRCRRLAVYLVGVVRQSPEKSVEVLINACQDHRVLVRSRAASALGRFGTAAQSAVPQLKRLLKDEYRSVRDSATQAVRVIQP